MGLEPWLCRQFDIRSYVVCGKSYVVFVVVLGNLLLSNHNYF